MTFLSLGLGMLRLTRHDSGTERDQREGGERLSRDHSAYAQGKIEPSNAGEVVLYTWCFQGAEICHEDDARVRVSKHKC